MQAILVTCLCVLAFLTIGITHIVWARGLTRFYRRQYPSKGFLGALISPFRIWVESAFYETWLRVAGAISIALALFLLFVMVRGLLTGQG